MAFFKKLFSRKKQTESQSSDSKWLMSDAIIALVEKLPVDLSAALLAPQFLEGMAPVEILAEQHLDDYMFAQIQFGRHEIHLIGEDESLSEEIQKRTLFPSNWAEPEQELMRSHRAHIRLIYVTGDTNRAEQMAALYAVACALDPLGVADEVAMNAVPRTFLREITPETLDECRTVLPTLIWTGILKYQLPEGRIYYVSTGFQRFGIRNLAHLAPASSGEMVMNLFDSLLNYQWANGIIIGPFETSENSTQRMRFNQLPDEYSGITTDQYAVLDVIVTPK
jgi:hypothetical protein